MNNNESLNTKTLSNDDQHNNESKESSISEQTGKISFAEAEYRYLKWLNEKLPLFKNDEQSGKNNKQN